MMTTETKDQDTDTTRDTPEASGALPGEELAGLDLKAFGLDGIEPGEERPPAPAQASEERSEPDGGRPRPKGDLRKALHEERGERRRANERAERYRQIAEEVTKRTATQDPGLNLRGTVQPIQATPARLTPDQRRQLIESARGATDFGAPTEALLTTVEQLLAAQAEAQAAAIQGALEAQAIATERAHSERETARLERAFARDYPDYADTVRRAGIGEMLSVDPRTGQRGPRFNLRVAEEIADADNPVEAAYFIAKGLLGQDISHRPSASGRETDSDSPSPSPSDRPTDRRPPATSERPAAAERRPAPGSERVVDNGARPRSVRDLPPAGAPQGMRLDDTFKAYLDGQWKKNPEGVLKLFGQRPDIQRWYEGG